MRQQKIFLHRHLKLCCPVCWEICKAVKRQHQAIPLAGYCHFDPLPAPQLVWNVVKQMITLLQDCLRNELNRMMINVTPPPTHSPDDWQKARSIQHYKQHIWRSNPTIPQQWHGRDQVAQPFLSILIILFKLLNSFSVTVLWGWSPCCNSVCYL